MSVLDAAEREALAQRPWVQRMLTNILLSQKRWEEAKSPNFVDLLSFYGQQPLLSIAKSKYVSGEIGVDDLELAVSVAMRAGTP